MRCWEFVISAISAIATTLAVIVALWQSKIQWKKKLYVGFVNNLSTNRENTIHPDYLEITITNCGNVKVAITNIFLGCISLPIENIDNQLFYKPYLLDIGETMEFLISWDFFIEANKILIKDSTRKTDKKIELIVEEITGKKFKTKLEHTPNEYIKWDKGEIKLYPVLE